MCIRDSRDAVLRDGAHRADAPHLGPLVVIRDDDRVREPRRVATHRRRIAHPVGDHAQGSPKSQHAVRDDTLEPERARGPVAPVDRVEVGRRSGVPNELRPRQRDCQLADLRTHLDAHEVALVWTKVDEESTTGSPSSVATRTVTPTISMAPRQRTLSMLLSLIHISEPTRP